MTKTFSVFLLSFVALAQTVPGRYIVELSAEPAGKSTRKAALQSQQSRVRTLLEQQNSRVIDSIENVANALIVESSDPEAIAALPGVVRVTPDRLYKLYLDRAVELQQVAPAWAQIGGIQAAGRGMKIGILDTGIDNTHPAFQDTSLPALDGFPKLSREENLSLANNKIIVVRNYDRSPTASARDTRGHGTSVAMVAAGVTNAGPRGAITGIAPNAYLGNYKVFPEGSDNAPSSAILKAIDDAVADGMDVINLSLGLFPAPHLRNDPFADAIERATAAGVIVVVAAGNEGPDLNTIGSPGTAPSAITVGNAYSDRIFSASATLENATPYLSLPSDNSVSRPSLRAQLSDVSTLDRTGLACTELPAASLSGKIALILRGECLFSEKLTIAQTAGAVAALVYTHANDPEPITMATGSASLPAAMISYADGVDASSRLRSSPNLEMVLNFAALPVAVNPSRLGSSSSKGPSVDLAIKPELLGIGTAVYTASPNNAYTIANGTSLSSPMIAGAAALLKAARPGLRPEQYRSLLINTVNPFTLTSSTPVQQTGAGLLNLWNAVNSTLAVNPATISFGVSNGTADYLQSLTVTNLGSQSDQFSLTVVPAGAGPAPVLAADTVSLMPGQSRILALRFQAFNLQPETYQGFVIVRGNTSNVEARVPYWLAVPSSVASKISVIEPPASGSVGSTQTFRVRVLDSSGVALTSEPQVSVISGGGAGVSVQSLDAQIPGIYRISVRLGDVAEDNVFQVEAAGTAQRVSIRAQ